MVWFGNSGATRKQTFPEPLMVQGVTDLKTVAIVELAYL